MKSLQNKKHPFGCFLCWWAYDAARNTTRIVCLLGNNESEKQFSIRAKRSCGHESTIPHQQKRNFCLPKVPFLFIQAAVGVPRSELDELWGFPQAWYIIAARSAVHIIKGGKPPLYLISPFGAVSLLRLDDIQCFALMIFSHFVSDDIHFLRK